MDAYLREKIADHIAAILSEYIMHLDDIMDVTDDIMDAIEREVRWAESNPR